MEKHASYLTSAYYFRAALRGASTKHEAVEIGIHVVAELEALKSWVREQGLMPPRWYLLPAELAARQAAGVYPFQPSEAPPPRGA
jgi:hypothetical protein